MKLRVELSSIATKSISGVGHYTKRLAEALDTSPGAETQGVYFNFLHRQPVPDISLKKTAVGNPFFPLRVYAKLQSFNIAPPFDIALPHADVTIFPNFATWPTVRSKLRATTVHDLTYIHFPELVEEKNLAHLRRVVPRSIKKADFILTVSEAVKAELVEHFKLDPSRCVVTSIPPEPGYFVKNDNEIHKKYGIPTEKYIFFIGNLEPRKNLSTLVEAYQLLPDNIKSEYSLVLAGGKGWKTEKSKQSIQKAQDAGEKVVHIGYADQADAAALFQKASVFVMPSFYEGFGMPLLEAMAGKTPVVTSDIPVMRETAGDAALYANPNDPQGFASHIEAILQSTELVDELNKKAALQLTKVSWEDNAAKIVKRAEELLKS